MSATGTPGSCLCGMVLPSREALLAHQRGDCRMLGSSRPAPKQRPAQKPSRTVSSALHARILKRDGQCFGVVVDPAHVCADSHGQTHAATELGKLTVDHVNDQPGGVRGKRAPSDEQHLVAACFKLNVGGPSAHFRAEERRYLKGLYPGGTK